MKSTKDLQLLLEEIYLRRSDDFSGIGIIFYKTLVNLPIASLKNTDSKLRLPIVSRSEIIAFLVSASTNNNKYHDGFHLLNERLELTHVSQFVSPPIVQNVNVQMDHGSRYRTAVYTSMLPNVIACGVLSNNYVPTVFVNGKEL
jgi:hypothetical protein